MTGVSSPAARRFVAPLLRGGAIVAAVLVLAGCQEGSVGMDGTGGSTTVDGSSGSDSGGSGGANGFDETDGSPGGSYSDSGSGSVSGSGHLTSRKLNCPGVTTLVVGVSFVVHLKIGEPEQATIRMDDNLTDLVDATVTGSQLRLGLKPGANVRNATLAAEVTVRHLDQLTTSGVSQVTLDSELTGQALHLDATGTSHVAGTISVAELDASASGASTLALSGQVGQLNLHGAGTSGLRLSDLVTRNLEASLSGTSSATVAVSDTLAAQAGGASRLRYSGTPRITRQQTSGVASIAAQ